MPFIIDSFLQKPFNPASLKAAISKALHKLIDQVAFQEQQIKSLQQDITKAGIRCDAGSDHHPVSEFNPEQLNKLVD